MSRYNTPAEALYVLGLDQNATKEDIRSAYRHLAARYHPDSVQDDDLQNGEAFLEIREAYDYLMEAYEQALAIYMMGQRKAADYGAGGSFRVLGDKDTLIRQEKLNDMARQRLAQKKRMEKERLLQKRRADEELAARLKKAKEEEQLREHALRAAEITAEILQALVLKGGVDALDKPL